MCDQDGAEVPKNAVEKASVNAQYNLGFHQDWWASRDSTQHRLFALLYPGVGQCVEGP